MKLNALAIIIFLLLSLACTKKDKVVDEHEIQVGHNMKIFPEAPDSKDMIKLVVYDDCMYNTLSSNKRSGKTINIEKQVNSSMKLPCVQRNDTIVIGKLPQGTYNVNYTLVDISLQAPQNISFSYTFQLEVTR